MIENLAQQLRKCKWKVIGSRPLTVTMTILASALTGSNCTQFSAAAQISATVSLDQSSYVVGEPIEVTITAINSSPDPVTLSFPSSLQSQYLLDDSYINNQLGLAVFTQAIVPANGTHEWKYFHRWDDYPLGAGAHELIGRVMGYASSDPVTFDVVAPDPVVNDVFIDFETFPNGDPIRGIWSSAFSALGVTFHSDGGTIGLHRDENNNTMIDTKSGAHPFNVVAEFDMDVFTISADVGAAAGYTVTMHAYDKNGELLGAKTSLPISAYPELVGPLSFTSHVPITRVKWFASNPRSTVMVDNLLLGVTAVPEPSIFGTILGAMIGGLGFRRDYGKPPSRPSNGHPEELHPSS